MSNHLIAIISETQKNELIGHEWEPKSQFNPIQDINDNWVISQEEVNGNVNPDFSWVNSLTLSEFEPKPQPFPPNE